MLRAFELTIFALRRAPWWRVACAGAAVGFAHPFVRAADAPAPATPAEYVSRSWTTDQGLPHNVVTRIQQDNIGYLWLATLAGLTRFDGREFKVYRVPANPTGGGRNIRDLAVTTSGTVLFVPASGGVWQLRDGRMTRHAMSSLLEGETLLGIFVEPEGAVWVETSVDLARWENGRLERFGRNEGISRRSLHFSWAADSSRRIWIGGPNFLGYYQEGKLHPLRDTTNLVYRVAPARAGGVWVFGDKLYRCEGNDLIPVGDTPWPEQRASARCLYEDRTGVLWVASSREGVFCFDGRQYRPLPDVESGVEYVTEDREGNVWLATDGGGIRRVRPKAFTLIDRPVTTVSADASGTIWLAGQSAGIIRVSGETAEEIPHRFSRTVLSVNVVVPDYDGNLWVGSQFGVFQSSVRDPHTIRRIDGGLRNPRVLFPTQHGDVWVYGPSALGYFRDSVYTSLAEKLPTGQEITAIAEHPAGHLWFGTSRGNLFESDGQSLARTNLDLGIGEGTIHTILPAAGGVFWLGTTEGLVRVEGTQVRRLTEADGLPDDIVLQLLEDNAGDFWMSTPRGIYRVHESELLDVVHGRSARVSPIAYGPEQGLFGISPSTNYPQSAVKDPHGDLWFCTYRGALGIHPSRLQHDSTPPPVLIDQVEIDDVATTQLRTLRVPSGDHRIDFRFAALSFAAPERVQLRHQLEGFDNGWVDTAPDRTARYAKLPPGRYRIRVIASNSEGIWNRTGATLAFEVLPAWWQTTAFQIVAVLGFAGVVGAGARYWSQRKLRARIDRLEREHALEKERARISRDMHDELGGSVTGINLVVQRLRDDAPAPASEALLDVLDRRVRRLTVELERVVWTVSPKNSSLEQLATFIERFARNLFADSSIACHVFGRAEIPARPLNPETQHHVLAVTKEAINNVLKHSQASVATITMRFHDPLFLLSVQDDGDGFAPEAQSLSERNGLRNMRSRMAEVHGTLAIESQPGEGTTITLQVPIAPPKPS